MGYVADYMKAEAELYSKNTGENNIRAEFHNWKVKQIKSVSIVSYKTLPIAKEIFVFLKTHPPKLKGCFDNSFWAATTINGVDYVEGCGGISGIGIEHSWNSYNGIHFVI